ncbi:tRNA (adenosine(37)-N6)-threonylcarbamoyltransferase complex dimerization subunit type 1 TsaB [Blattabacterium cuenoti]|uniref:tRNA (adenosine(37)-N6)-threonylcarbamoyltransferase complex dimerization subunit type 1 TsaB n=1 Tax=Blattabacterium cuenoti TaxID=1653831 RepID=UPI00163D0D69|nr:tRNA (adenosine(37)-N6)-threonylcarbamoyltransferase complex dimerization subunit type 1 TsaB [Blattabacterium cuenoti]
MSLILNLDTSTNNCSVSISKNGKILSLVEETSQRYLHSEKLHKFIEYALKLSMVSLKDIKSICVNRGPGSYSSLRVGIAAAKGFCISLKIPLLSMDSLTILTQKILKKIKNKKNTLIIPMIYAKKNFFYTTLFDSYSNMLYPISIRKKINYLQITNHKIYIISNFNFYLKNSNKYIFIKDNISSYDMSYLSYNKFCKNKFHNINQFLPIYL